MDDEKEREKVTVLCVIGMMYIQSIGKDDKKKVIDAVLQYYNDQTGSALDTETILEYMKESVKQDENNTNKILN